MAYHLLNKSTRASTVNGSCISQLLSSKCCVPFRASKKIQLTLLALAAVVGFLFLFQQVHPRVGAVDFLQYWSAAQILAKGGNPYDHTELLLMEQSVWNPALRGSLTLPVVMYNPPLIFPFIAGLRWFHFESVRSWWCFGIFASTALSIYLLIKGRIIGLSSRRHLYSLAAALVTFPPLYALLFYGQLSHLLLLSLTAALVLALQTKTNPFTSFWSGFALSLALVKPHILWLVYAVMFFGSLQYRSFRMLLGCFCGGLLFLAIPLLLYPDLAAQYWQFMHSPPVFWRTATVGSWMQYLSGLHLLSVKLVPTLVFLLISFFYCRWKIDEKKLLELFPLSLVFAPYGWVYDQMVVLPLVLWLLSNAPASKVVRLAAMVIGLNIIDFFLTLNWGQESGILYQLG
jgi:hypothetical protein